MKKLIYLLSMAILCGVFYGCEDGPKKLVSRISISIADGEKCTDFYFSYDEKDRVVAIKSQPCGDNSYGSEWKIDYTGNAVVWTYRDNTTTEQVNKKGNLESASSESGKWTLAYDGKQYLTSSRSNTNKSVREWKDGNLAKVDFYRVWDGADEALLVSSAAQYDSELTNKANLDFTQLMVSSNAFGSLLPNFEDLLGLCGKRSKNLMVKMTETAASQGETTMYEYNYEFDEEGFVSKVNASTEFKSRSWSDKYNVVLTIEYIDKTKK